MNTFLYPLSDTYISSKQSTTNFGLDEILELEAIRGKPTTVIPSGSFWHPLPANEGDYGEVGWVSFDETNQGWYSYIKQDSKYKWKFFSIPDGSGNGISSGIHFVNFSGSLYSEVLENETYFINGKSENLTGYFFGKCKIKTPSKLSGSVSRGSFTGTIYTGSTFDTMIFNEDQTIEDSPLTDNLTGKFYLVNFSGEMDVYGETSKENICFPEGTFSGSITSLHNFDGNLTLMSDFNVFVDNTELYSDANYSGEINPENLPFDAILDQSFTRALLKFDFTNIINSFTSEELENIKYNLRLTACSQRNLPFNYNVYAYPISQSWCGGTGRSFEDIGEGASWLYRNYTNGTPWSTYNLTSSLQSVDYFLDELNSTDSFEKGGGTWYYNNPISGESLLCSQSFNQESQGDIYIDITKIVNSWINNNIPNEGVILMLSQEIASSPENISNSNLQFFSKETNTIYSPTLQIGWDDSTFDTGSLSVINDNSEEILLNFRNLKSNYTSGEIVKVIVFARKRNQLKQFNKSFQQPNMVTPVCLPDDSKFMLIDAESNFVLFDFSEHTKLSCDPTIGNYFCFDTTGIPLERYYKFRIKCTFSNNITQIFESDKIFKVTR